VAGAGRAVGVGLAWFLTASYFNGIVVEVGRKIRSPGDEEEGVETYSALWGRGRAVLVWIGAMAATTLCAALAAREVGAAWLVCVVLGALALMAVVLGVSLVRAPAPGSGKRLEVLSGVWTIAMYLSVGVASLALYR
jgi:hypothetical protein